MVLIYDNLMGLVQSDCGHQLLFAKIMYCPAISSEKHTHIDRSLLIVVLNSAQEQNVFVSNCSNKACDEE